MKKIACIKSYDTYKTVTAWDVYNGKKTNPNFWNKVKFYSTHSKPENKVELVFVNNNGTLFFRYSNSNDETSYKNSNPNSETLTHQICKDYLSKLNEVKFNVKNRTYIFDIVNSEVEKTISINNKYIVDILFNFKSSNPSYLLQKWNGIFAVEIFVTHKVDDIKRKDLYNFKYPIFEVLIPSHIKDEIENTLELNDAVIQKYNLVLKEFFSNEITANLISDPSSEYFYKAQLKKLYTENKELKSKNNELLSKIQSLAQIVQDRKNTSILLESELAQYKKSVIDYQNSIFYKFYKLFNRR